MTTKVTKFEDLMAWQSARELANLVYRLSSKGESRQDFSLREQMRRAAVSAVSNIAEGFDRGGNKEFLYFLGMAKGSIGEVRAQAFLANDLGYISPEALSELQSGAHRTSRILWGVMRYLSESELKGSRYKRSHIPTRKVKEYAVDFEVDDDQVIPPLSGGDRPSLVDSPVEAAIDIGVGAGEWEPQGGMERGTLPLDPTKGN